MTMQVYIYHGTTTIDLQASGCAVLDGYFPNVAQTPEQHVTDTIQCRFIGSEADARALINSINMALRTAQGQKDQDTDETSTWLYFEMAGDDTEWRSRIYDGVMSFSDKLDHNWRRRKLDFTLTIERQGYWEGPVTNVPLVNDNSVTASAALTIYDCNDGTGSPPAKRQFFAVVDGNDVDGDLPGPAIFTIEPDQAINALIIGQYVDERALGTYPLAHIEAESLTCAKASTQTSGAASNGEYAQIDLDIASITMTGTYTLDNFRGSYIRVFGHFFTPPPADVWMEVIFMSEDVVIGQTPKVKLSTDLIQTLGIVRLPNIYLTTPLTAADLQINITCPGTSGHLDFDVLYLIGVDYYTELVSSKTAIEGIIHEEWGNQRLSYLTVERGEATVKMTYFDQESGEGIYLEPGLDQKLFFLFMGNGDAEITWKISTLCSYRPRRLAL